MDDQSSGPPRKLLETGDIAQLDPSKVAHGGSCYLTVLTRHDDGEVFGYVTNIVPPTTPKEGSCERIYLTVHEDYLVHVGVSRFLIGEKIIDTEVREVLEAMKAAELHEAAAEEPEELYKNIGSRN